MTRALIMLAALLLATPVAAQVNNPGVSLAEIQAMKDQLATQAMVQSETITLDANGDATWTFSPAFNIVPDVVHMPKSMDRINPIICNFTAISTTAVTVHCWRTNTLGLLGNLLSGTVTGATVKLIARAIP